MYKKPELLAPAGNLEKCKIALTYGADAVYIGGHVFGLRKYADNFTTSQMKAAIDFANDSGKKVYVVLNGFAHTSDMKGLSDYLASLEVLQPHALIISDMGVFQRAKAETTIPLHVSTQASVTNAYGCKFWKEAGAERVILAREVSLSDCARIKSQLDVDLEIFIHGAMCASYSGKCVISNYTAGRDSNRGGCVQSCRHEYELIDPITKTVLDKAHVMNAKDLMGLETLPEIMRIGIDSVKVEGRMKSNLYTANIAACYRQAIDATYDFLTQDQNDYAELYRLYDTLTHNLEDVSNRQFSTGGLLERPVSHSINDAFDAYEKRVEFIGTVQAFTSKRELVVEVKGCFKPGDALEILTQDGKRHSFVPDWIHTLQNGAVLKTNPSSVVKLPPHSKAHLLSILIKLL